MKRLRTGEDTTFQFSNYDLLGIPREKKNNTGRTEDVELSTSIYDILGIDYAHKS